MQGQGVSEEDDSRSAHDSVFDYFAYYSDKCNQLCAVYAFNVCTTYGRQADSGLHCVVVIRSSVPM